MKRSSARGEASKHERVTIRTLATRPSAVNNFNEVDLTLSEEEALAEAERCLRCGVCSECLECVAACERGAISHEMEDEIEEFKVGTILLTTGFKDFDPHRSA